MNLNNKVPDVYKCIQEKLPDVPLEVIKRCVILWAYNGQPKNAVEEKVYRHLWDTPPRELLKL
jgi:hypothetical protein